MDRPEKVTEEKEDLEVQPEATIVPVEIAQEAQRALVLRPGETPEAAVAVQAVQLHNLVRIPTPIRIQTPIPVSPQRAGQQSLSLTHRKRPVIQARVRVVAQMEVTAVMAAQPNHQQRIQMAMVCPII